MHSAVLDCTIIPPGTDLHAPVAATISAPGGDRGDCRERRQLRLPVLPQSGRPAHGGHFVHVDPAEPVAGALFGPLVRGYRIGARTLGVDVSSYTGVLLLEVIYAKPTLALSGR